MTASPVIIPNVRVLISAGEASGVTVEVTDSASAGIFLLCYLGSGQRVELASGAESTIVTPFKSGDYQLLPVGMGLTVAPGTP